ncbi:RNA polymerase sigma factor [Nocardia aurea]|uniref:RNA polymerase sigma factor n=1 Tax=Nocardia aurea TaxID=2144174 RepID=A0ABV3G5V0_9NOCA
MEAETNSLDHSRRLQIGRYIVDIGDLVLKLLPVAKRLTRGHQDDAEDLVQRTVMRLLERGKQVQVKEDPVAYARKVLRNLFLDDLRRAKARPEDFSTDHTDQPPPLGQPSESWQATVRLDIETAMAKLSPAAQRVVTLLIDWESGSLQALPQTEVAQRLGINVASVASTLRDARRQLTQHLPRYLEDIA